MVSNLQCVSEMGRFPMRIQCSGQWSWAQLRIRRFQFHPRCQQSHHCPHGLMVSLPRVPEMSHWSQVTGTVNMLWQLGVVPPPMQWREWLFFTRSSGRPDPERLRDMDLTRGDSQFCGEDNYDPEIAVSSHAEVCPCNQIMQWIVGHAIPVSPVTDPPIPETCSTAMFSGDHCRGRLSEQFGRWKGC